MLPIENYYWSSEEEKVRIDLKVDEPFTPENIHVHFALRSITVEVDISENLQRRIYLGDLLWEIKPEESSWRSRPGKIIVFMKKKDNSNHWGKLLSY